QADAELAKGEAEIQRAGRVEAIRIFDRAKTLYAQASREARELRRRRREDAEQKRQSMVNARDNAVTANANRMAHMTWNEAEARTAVAEEAFTSETYEDAAQAFEQASMLYLRAAETATESARRHEMERAARRAREAASEARQTGVDANASQYAQAA